LNTYILLIVEIYVYLTYLKYLNIVSHYFIMLRKICWNLFFIFHSFVINGLMPKKLPNGNSRKFIANIKEPRKDLLVISPGTASLISKNWMQNILLDVMCRRRSKDLTNIGEFVYDDLHIMSAIQELQNDIEKLQKKPWQTWSDSILSTSGTNRSFPLMYMAWKPRSLQGMNEVLFVVIAQLIKKQKNESDVFYFEIKNIVQSPFWDEEQIPSIYLKNALLDQNHYTNQTSICFDSLYETNLRYKLAWETWFYDMKERDD